MNDFFSPSAIVAFLCLLYAAKNMEGRSKRALDDGCCHAFRVFGEGTWAFIEVILQRRSIPICGRLRLSDVLSSLCSRYLSAAQCPSFSSGRLGVILDSAIVIISAALVFWIFFFAPVVSSLNTITLELTISLAYSMMDIVLFVALVRLVLSKLDASTITPALFLAAGMAIVLVADAVFSIQTQKGTYISGGHLDTFWISSNLYSIGRTAAGKSLSLDPLYF